MEIRKNKQVRLMNLSCFSRGRSRKRGMFFGLYLVVITLLMCGVVFFVRYQQSDDLPNELVSPSVVLDIVDGLDIFEMREKKLIEDSLVGVEFGADGFDGEFRKKFLDGIGSDEKMKGFIFDRLIVNGRDVAESDGFFENILYPDRLTYEDGGKLYVGRDRVGKRIVFAPPIKSSNYFPVDFSFEFERGYVVSEVGGKIKVEVAE